MRPAAPRLLQPCPAPPSCWVGGGRRPSRGRPLPRRTLETGPEAPGGRWPHLGRTAFPRWPPRGRPPASGADPRRPDEGGRPGRGVSPWLSSPRTGPWPGWARSRLLWSCHLQAAGKCRPGARPKQRVSQCPRSFAEFTREVTDTQMPLVAPVILPEMYKIFTMAEVRRGRRRRTGWGARVLLLPPRRPALTTDPDRALGWGRGEPQPCFMHPPAPARPPECHPVLTKTLTSLPGDKLPRSRAGMPGGVLVSGRTDTRWPCQVPGSEAPAHSHALPPGVRHPHPRPGRGDLHHLRPHDLQHGGAGEGSVAGAAGARGAAARGRGRPERRGWLPLGCVTPPPLWEPRLFRRLALHPSSAGAGGRAVPLAPP